LKKPRGRRGTQVFVAVLLGMRETASAHTRQFFPGEKNEEFQTA